METIRQLEALWAYASRCALLPAHVPACDSFWNGAATVAAVVFGLAALYIVRRIVKNLLAVRAARMRELEETRTADPMTLAKYKAETDKYFDVPADEDVQKRIRDALDERRMSTSPKREGVE